MWNVEGFDGRWANGCSMVRIYGCYSLDYYRIRRRRDVGGTT